MDMKSNFGFDSFVLQPLGYYSFSGKNCEICLEPCLNGCDVAVYDKRKDLLEPKYCTNLNRVFVMSEQDTVALLAIKKAKEYYEKYE